MTVGKENLVFESGPFCHFGSHVLTAVSSSNIGKLVVWFHSPPRLQAISMTALLPFLHIGDSPSSAQLFRGSLQSMQAPPVTAELPAGTGGSSIRGPVFVADYTVRAVTDVVYLWISRSLYLAARNATLLERAQRDATQRAFDYESDLEQAFCTSSHRDKAESVISIRCASLSQRFR